MLTGTLLSNVGPNPATKPLQPDSRHVAATVDAIDAYGCDGDGDCGDGEVRRDEGGTDWILVLITSMGKLRGRGRGGRVRKGSGC